MEPISNFPARLWKKLMEIPCSSFPLLALSYRPAKAKLKDESVQNCFIFFGKTAYRERWGEDPNRTLIRIADIEDIFPSEYQLPPRFASLVCSHSEVSWGGHEFTLTMGDGKSFYYSVGGIADFINYPEGYSARVISDVHPRIPQDILRDHRDAVLSGPNYAWCLFEESELPPEELSVNFHIL